jgi:SAM-dependent methyltransferase
VAFNEHFLGKPKDKEDHKRILRILSNTTHKVISAICIIDTRSKKNVTAIETTFVTVEKLEESDIEAYVASGEGDDKAGGYAIQGLGCLFCRKIEGDYFNVVGLPMYRLRKLLKEFGLKAHLIIMTHTPLQKSFPKDYLNRSLLKVKTMFRKTDVKMLLTFSKIVRRSKDSEVTVLDLGCGSGTTIEDFWQKMSNQNWRYKRRLHGKNLNTIGIDISPLPAMIPKRIFKTAPTPQTKFIKADAEKLPLADNSVDFAYSVGLLRYLKDPLRALEEGYRVLKPGGVFLWLLSGYTDISTKPTIEKILEGTPGASRLSDFVSAGVVCVEP